MNYPIIHADRDFRFHHKLKTALAGHSSFYFLDHCCYLDSALQLLNAHQSQLVITASKLYDEPDAVEAFCQYRDACMPNLKILVLTSKEDMDHFLNAVVQGVDAYLAKASSTEETVSALDAVINGQHYLGVQKGTIKHK